MWQRPQLNNRIDTKLEHSSITRAPNVTILHGKIRCVFKKTSGLPRRCPHPARKKRMCEPGQIRTVLKLLRFSKSRWVRNSSETKHTTATNCAREVHSHDTKINQEPGNCEDARTPNRIRRRIEALLKSNCAREVHSLPEQSSKKQKSALVLKLLFRPRPETGPCPTAAAVRYNAGTPPQSNRSDNAVRLWRPSEKSNHSPCNSLKQPQSSKIPTSKLKTTI